MAQFGTRPHPGLSNGRRSIFGIARDVAEENSLLKKGSRCLFNETRRSEVSGSRPGPVPPGDTSLMPPLGA
jgi:hypothetical protein